MQNGENFKYLNRLKGVIVDYKRIFVNCNMESENKKVNCVCFTSG